MLDLDYIAYDEVLCRIKGERPHLLLGNGFSRACRDDIFSYGALFDRADFSKLSPEAQRVFDALETTDFEIVINALRRASILLELYSAADNPLVSKLRGDADGLREVLVTAIADSHPDRPSDIPDSSYETCRRFLSGYNRIYTLNYDLLLYWALMHKEVGPSVTSDDGFRSPDYGEQEYVSWEIEKTDSQKIFYLHGGLHLFDAGHELQKYTWCNTGIKIIEQVREALKNNKYPLFVAEGNSMQKLQKIKHSDYLSRGLRSFAKIGGTLVVFGVSFGDSDNHILNLLKKGRISQLYVGLYSAPDHSEDIIASVTELSDGSSPNNPLRVSYFDAKSATIWG